jgi:hypothetical protein
LYPSLATRIAASLILGIRRVKYSSKIPSKRGSAGPALRPCGFSSGAGSCRAAHKIIRVLTGRAAQSASRWESHPSTDGLECEPCATLAFRQRHFVPPNPDGFILTFTVLVDIITKYYCGVQSCPRASPPPSRSPARLTYEVSRAKFRRQDPRDEKPGLIRRMEDSNLRLIYDCRWSICEGPPLWRLTNVLLKDPKRGAEP